MSKSVLVVDPSKKQDGEQSADAANSGKGHLARKNSRSRLRGGSLTGKGKKDEKEPKSKQKEVKGQDSLSQTRGNDDDAEEDSDEVVSREADGPSPITPSPLLAAAISSGGAHASGTSTPTSNEPAPVVISKAVDFSVPDSEDNILFIEGTTLVKAATFSKLIERLTCQTDFIDPDDFLFSYRLFATAEEVLNAIFIRYKSIDKEQDKAMKIRIFNFFKKWVEKFWLDLSREEVNATLLLNFVDGLIKDPNTTGADLALAKMVHSKVEQKQKEGASATVSPVVESFTPSAASHVDKGVFEYSAQDIANHLTRIEWDMWIKVKENELLNCGWTKKNKLEISPNVVAMTRRFNQVSDWVASLILTEENLKKRVKLIAKFVEIAACLKTIGNYNGVLEIYSAFQRGPVARLKQSFSQLDPDIKQRFAEIEHLTNNTKNYANLRLAIADIDPPVLPYLGMYLTDILFAIEGNGPNINGMINFYRCRVYSETIKRIKQYQLLGFDSKEKVFIDANLLECLHHLPSIDESDLYTISAYIEPREGKEPGPRPDALIDGFLKNQREKKDSKAEKKKGKTDRKDEKKELKEIEKLLMKESSLTDSGGKSRSSNSRPHSGGGKEGPKSALLSKNTKRTSSFSHSQTKTESLSDILGRSEGQCEINLPVVLKPRSQSNTPPLQPSASSSLQPEPMGRGSSSVVSGTTSSDSTNASGLASPHSASSQGATSGGLPQLMPNWNANAINNATTFISVHPPTGSKSEGRRKTSISGVSGIESSRDDTKSGGGPESDEASLSHMDFGLQYPMVHQSLEKTRVTLDACVEGQKKLTAEHSELLLKVQLQEKELAQQRELIQNQAKELETLKTLFHVLMSMNKPSASGGGEAS